ncbi:MAG: 3-isopropylmalate dehydrogenase [Bacillota bacterium]
MKVAVLPGDGVGPEVTAEAVKVLKRVAGAFGLQLETREAVVGGAAIDQCGEPLPEHTLEVVDWADAVLFGAVGGPKWDSLPMERRPEQGILGLRKKLGLFINLRPVVLYPELAASSPLKEAVVRDGFDILMVRELSGGLYYGKPKELRQESGVRSAVDTMSYSEVEIARCVRAAFEAAGRRRNKLTSVDKSNVLLTSRLWRQVVDEMSEQYPNVAVEHQYVDSCAMLLVREPQRFDVLVTENTFGDILSDLGGALVGSLGMLPSASLGEGNKGLYEPVHGSAPDIAGKGVANPIGAVLSAAMMLEFSFGLQSPAEAIRRAVRKVIRNGYATRDVATPEHKTVGTQEMGDLICEELSKEVA